MNTMNGYCDLHLHSTYSDGRQLPEELVAMAKELGLGAVALCDHNSVKGLPRFMKAGETFGVKTLAGVEISCQYKEKEVHILGLMIPEEQWERVTEYLAPVFDAKEKSNRAMLERLQQAGVDITYADVEKEAGGGYINRVHFARAMVAAGETESVSTAFDTYLKEGNGFYLPEETARPDAIRVIEFLYGIGAVPLLAHPLLSFSVEELEEFLAEAKMEDLAGMETHYSAFTAEQTAKLMAIAQRWGLLCSGGSDFHGDNKPHIAMGTGMGNLAVPLSFVETMEEFLD